MQCTAGFQGLMAVTVVAMEMAMMAVVLPGVRGAPVSLDHDLSGAGDSEGLFTAYSTTDRTGRIVSSIDSPERRERFLKMLVALAELQSSIRVGSMMPVFPRGKKSGHRGAGKKNKVVVSEEAHRTATLPPVDRGGTVSGPSDRPPEAPGRGGKDPKKSKKPNKRVCFWKYCSQN